jgi:hypothetical protein
MRVLGFKGVCLVDQALNGVQSARLVINMILNELQPAGMAEERSESVSAAGENQGRTWNGDE